MIGLLLAFVAAANAAESPKEDADPGRGSSVNLEYDHNPGNLASYLLGGDIGLSKKVGLLANYKSDELPSGYASSHAASVNLGVEDDFSEKFTGGFGLEYDTLPDSVYAKGFNLGGHLRADQWRFGLLLRSLRYTSDQSLAGKELREKGIPERSLGADITFRFATNWKIKGGFTGYNYAGATPTELSTILAARADTTAGLLSAVEGFPKNSGILALIFQASDGWDLDLSTVRTRYELAPNSLTTTLGANCQVTEAWGIGPSIASLRQDGRKTGTIVGVQTSYSWE